MKRWFIPVLAVLSLGLAVFSVARTRPDRAPEPPPIEPPATPFAESVAAVGLVEANTENIAIGSHLSGVVARVHVVVGQAVQAADPLFTLDDRHLRAALALNQGRLGRAKARVRTAEATLADTRERLQFAERIQNPLAISAEELSRRRYAVKTMAAGLEEARAAVAVAEAEIRTVETEIERSTVRAPIAGEVLQVKVRAGEFAVAGVNAEPLIVLGGIHPLHLRVDVDEHETSRLRPEARAYAYPRGNAELKTELTLVRFEPLIVPKRSLTGDSTERVDTRVLQALYRFERGVLPISVGQQMDVYIDAAGATPTRSPEPAGPETLGLAARGEPR
ncbi:MAG: efflux RND transporter periplasmic adaptor subunit [Gammaproteobacteria bacterium]